MTKHLCNAIMLALLLVSSANASESCVNADGDAALINGDVASAKMEAIGRAKWAAIEQTVGVQIKASSLVQNFALMDDSIIKKTSGVVHGVRILSEKKDAELYHVRIHACVSPADAEKSVGGLARNTAVGVLIVSRSRQESQVVESRRYRSSVESVALRLDGDPFSAGIKQRLIDQDIQVVDLAGDLGMNGVKIARQLDRGDLSPVRKAMLGSMANVFILGQIDNVISSRKGSDIGYGLSMPMHRVTSQMTYKIFGRDTNGVVRVIHSGSSRGEGMALALEDANQEAMRDLAEKTLDGLVGSVVAMIKGKARVVDVTIKGVSDVDAHERIKDRLNQIPWVMKIKDMGIGHFKISYPEKTLYLANSLQRIEGLHIKEFSQLSIHGTYSNGVTTQHSTQK
ncbi:MAG: hypothetical protein Q9M26_09515 [Mariprofundales bacterium]|nr:hypothetical protein [Mariprofundales bacterium]